MKIKIAYMVALLMIILMVGCATKEAAPEAPEEAAPAVPAVPVEEAPAAPVEEVVEAAPEEGAAIPAEVDQTTIDRLKAACERGALSVCLALKNQHGIDWPPEVVEEAEPEVPAEETPAEETPPAPTE